MKGVLDNPWSCSGDKVPAWQGLEWDNQDSKEDIGITGKCSAERFLL